MLKVAVFALGLFSSLPTLANEPQLAYPVDEEKFFESYDKFTNVSGGILTGLRLGSFSGNLDLETISFVSPAENSKPFCVIGKTKDGKYSAENAYLIQPSISESSTSKLTMLKPFSFRFKRKLSKYNSENFATLAYQSNSGNCLRDESMVFVPQVIKDASDLSTLYLMVNSRERLVSIEFNKEANAQVDECRQLNGSNVAYDALCKILLEPKSEISKLIIHLDDGFGVETSEYVVQLGQ